MAVRTDDLDLDLDLDLSTRAGRAMGDSARFNTEDYAKLTPINPPTIQVPGKRYADDWDMEMRAWVYVEEFVRNGGWTRSPVLDIYDAIHTQNDFLVPNDTGATRELTTPAQMSAEVHYVLGAALNRADRAHEIVDQATGGGALSYWTGMLRLNPRSEKNSYMLMLVGRKIGECIAMGLKNIYKMRRPAQVYPLIMPIIDGPDTPSYPSSHSLQARMISGMLKLGLSVQSNWPAPATWPPVASTAEALNMLAARVAENREVAGVHYHMDSLCGHYAAHLCLQKIHTLGTAAGIFKTLIDGAKLELADLD